MKMKNLKKKINEEKDLIFYLFKFKNNEKKSKTFVINYVYIIIMMIIQNSLD
jgi:hypothetical protein